MSDRRVQKEAKPDGATLAAASARFDVQLGRLPGERLRRRRQLLGLRRAALRRLIHLDHGAVHLLDADLREIAHEVGPADVDTAGVEAPLQIDLEPQREEAGDDVADALVITMVEERPDLERRLLFAKRALHAPNTPSRTLAEWSSIPERGGGKPGSANVPTAGT